MTYCAVCHAPVGPRPPSKRSATAVCSKGCALVAARAQRWDPLRRRMRHRNGYLCVFVGAGHHLADGQGYAPLHRLIVERRLGRCLEALERVKFLNGNRLDVRDQNLVVYRVLARVGCVSNP